RQEKFITNECETGHIWQCPRPSILRRRGALGWGGEDAHDTDRGVRGGWNVAVRVDPQRPGDELDEGACGSAVRATRTQWSVPLCLQQHHLRVHRGHGAGFQPTPRPGGLSSTAAMVAADASWPDP